MKDNNTLKMEEEIYNGKPQYISNDDDSEEIIEVEPDEDDDDTSDIDDAEVVEVEEDQGESEIIKDQEPNENFDEVLQLTEYTDGSLTPPTTGNFTIAEYKDIDTVTIDSSTRKMAKKFVDKVRSFVVNFNDVQLTEEHKDYIKQVANFEIMNLQDLLSMVQMNKNMISNIVARVNATQAEDYAIINTYNNLLNQHMKLWREASNLVKSIPNTMKKMRAEILTNQELGEGTPEGDQVITPDFQETQFNSSKQLLNILNKKKAEEKEKAESKPESGSLEDVVGKN